MKPPDLSRMPVFVLVARVKIGSLSLPFTGQPFVEAPTCNVIARTGCIISGGGIMMPE